MNQDSLSILIQALLDDKGSEVTIMNQINAIKQKLEKHPILLKLHLDTSGIKNFQEQVRKTTQSAVAGTSQSGSPISVAEFKQASVEMEKIISNAERIRMHFEKLGDVRVNQIFDQAGDSIQKFEVSVDNINNKIKETSKFIVSVGEGGLSFEKIQMASKNASVEISKAQKELQKLYVEAMKLNQQIDVNLINPNITPIQSLQAQKRAEIQLSHEMAIVEDKYRTQQKIKIDASAQAQQKLNQQVDLYKQKMLGGNGFRGEMQIFADKNPKFANQTNELIKQIEAIDAKAPDATQKMKQFSASFASLKAEAGQAGTVMGRALENAMKFMRFYLVGGALVGVFRQVRAAADAIKEIDAGLTQLRKVTAGTMEEMQKFSGVANNIAINMGKTTAEVINAATEFARLGYSIQQASMLAEKSILFSTVGNMSVDQATTTLISTIKAFGVEVDESGKNVTDIIDRINKVGNEFAISQADIGEILKRSSSAMRASGNNLSQSISLGVGAQEVVQDASVVGTALKTMSMRIRGVGEDMEDLADLVPKLESNFKSIGLTLKKDNDTFKSTYEIMKDLAGVWDNLTDMKQAEMLELVAGKVLPLCVVIHK
jgi:TP901 family phage tail tape measure protein